MKKYAGKLTLTCAVMLVSSSAWAGYVRVGSITSTGSGSSSGQFVNTGIALASDDKIEISFVPTSVSATGCLFCNRTSGSVNTFTMFISSQSHKFAWHYKDNSAGAKTSNDDVVANKQYVIVVDGATGKWYVNGDEMENSQTPSVFTPGGKLVFFASYSDGGSLSGAGNYAAVRFYYAKVWGSDGVLKHHFVPAMDDTKSEGSIDRFGLMDLQCGNAFSPNTGTTSFLRVAAGMRVWAGTEGGDLADSGNWTGSSGDYLFDGDALATLSGDWSPSDSIRIDRGASVTFDIGIGHSIVAPAFCYKYSASSSASAYSTARFLNGTYTFNGSGKYFEPYSADGVTTVISNATFSTGGNSIYTEDSVVPAPKGSAMEVIDGAKLTANNMHVNGIGNSMKADGSGTELRLNGVYVGRATDRGGNRLDVSGGAVLKADAGFVIGGAYNSGSAYSSASNVVVVSSGGMLQQSGDMFYIGRNGDWNTMRVTDGGVVSNASDYTMYIGSEASHNSAIIEGAGSLCYSRGNMTIGSADTSTSNMLCVGNGAKLTVLNITVNGIGNSAKADGSGTEVRLNGVYVGRTAGRDGNRLEVSDGAVLKADEGIVIGGAYNSGAAYSSASNVVVVSGGGVLQQSGYLFYVGRNGDWNTMRVTDGGVVSNASDYTMYIGSESSHNSAIIEGVGSLCYSRNIKIGNANTSADNMLFVGDGAVLTGRELRFGGNGNSLVVSNATAALDPSGSGFVVTTNATMRFAGAESSLRCHHVSDGSQNNVLAPSSILEFAVPEDGWREAPFRTHSGFRIPSGVALRIDGDSVENYLQSNPQGGKIPLMACDDNAASIVVDDIDALSANLPANCKVVLENRTVKLKINSRGFMMILK